MNGFSTSPPWLLLSLAARLINSVRVFDYAFVAVALALNYLVVRRYTRLSAGLESGVSARTQELGARQEQLNALVRAGQTVMEGLDLRQILERIVGEASQIAGTPHVKVLLVDSDAKVLRVAALVGSQVPAGFELSLTQSYSGRVVTTGQPVVVADTQNDPRNPLVQRDREAGIRTFLGLPIRRKDEVLGVLTFNTESPREYGQEEIDYLMSFADQAAIAIDHGRLYRDLEERVSQLHTVTRLNRLISSSLDNDRVLREIARAAAELLGAPVGSFWLANEATRTLRVVGFSDPMNDEDWPNRTLTFDEGGTGWVARHGRMLNVSDVFRDGRFVALDWSRRHGLQSFLGVPVILEGRLLAVLSVNGREPFRLDAEDERLLESFVGQAALAVRNATLYTAEGAARQAAERALAEVKQLQGMLPICSYCKKIRNDENSWEQLESYISDHSHTTFSHGICPDCRTRSRRDLETWKASR